MTYEVEFVKSAQKEFLKLPKNIQIKIAKAINNLRQNPRLGSVRPMVGVEAWRLRVGDYRVIYTINKNELVILVIRIRHRKDVYKNLN